MININEIISSSVDKNVKSFFDMDRTSPSSDEESQSRIYKTLMQYSGVLLEQYHEALKKELAKQGIDI